ncbi:three-Cys-motif partner protein TcmP [Pseudonocardia adelaidensis]|uniref:Three-Cys-motif partner protein TcmP n=1 Tax=Pseudonocardia adelaidensis TaxID=648754 RepID=A0ABP9NW59_9PSEU
MVFAAKAGLHTAGNRVVFVDGYAGAGRYDDGAPGSPLLFMQAAQSMRDLRAVKAVFVEADEVNYQHLSELLGETAPPDANYLPLHGELGRHLPAILRDARGAALFVFLDPFGTALDRHQLCNSLLTQARREPTEVLLHFSVSTVARIGGLVRKAHRANQRLTASERKTVATVDRFLGGDWWHATFREIANDHDDGTANRAAMEVADRYCREIGEQTGFRAVPIPVQPAPHLLPKYVLVLFTRHQHGLWHFASTLGLAGRDWMGAYHAAEAKRAAAKTVAYEERHGLEPLFEFPEPEFDPDAYEQSHRDEWIDTLAENIARLPQQYGTFRPVDRTIEIYDSLMGQAWDKHVRAAVKKLYDAGITTNDGKNKFWLRPLEIVVPSQHPGPSPDQPVISSSAPEDVRPESA